MALGLMATDRRFFPKMETSKGQVIWRSKIANAGNERGFPDYDWSR